MPQAPPRAWPRRVIPAVIALLLLSGCGEQPQGVEVDPEQVDATEAPVNGACRNIAPEDLGNAANASSIVPCSEPHNAETFHVQLLPDQFADADYETRSVSSYAGRTCTTAFARFLGTDESTSMRTILTWAWFRPSENAWNDGARWFRCDVVGGAVDSPQLMSLPVTAAGLLADGPDDDWMACVDAPSVTQSPRIACEEPHVWRAVTTIKLGAADAKYPGDETVLRRTKDFCSGSVSAWLGYPPDFDFGYTWFGSAAWQAGNRRSVCWARTTK